MGRRLLPIAMLPSSTTNRARRARLRRALYDCDNATGVLAGCGGLSTAAAGTCHGLASTTPAAAAISTSSAAAATTLARSNDLIQALVKEVTHSRWKLAVHKPSCCHVCLVHQAFLECGGGHSTKKAPPCDNYNASLLARVRGCRSLLREPVAVPSAVLVLDLRVDVDFHNGGV